MNDPQTREEAELGPETPLDDLDLCARTKVQLQRHQVRCLADLARFTDDELTSMRYVGPASAAKLRACLRAAKLDQADEAGG
jgi:hypothetical protein